MIVIGAFFDNWSFPIISGAKTRSDTRKCGLGAAQYMPKNALRKKKLVKFYRNRWNGKRTFYTGRRAKIANSVIGIGVVFLSD